MVCYIRTTASNSVGIDRSVVGISTDFDTIANFVLVRHLKEPAPYMGQFLSLMGAHSVSGDTAPVKTECHPGRPWQIEEHLIYSRHQL